jgi:uncharacterized protein YjcR
LKENWELAYEDYKAGMKRKDIAQKYNVSINTVKSWKQRHWNKKEGAPPKRKKGAPLKNKNASGRTPKKDENQNARKHGFFAKWLPEEVNQIIGEMPEDPLDILWANIQMQMAAIVRAQNIMYVIDENDKTVEKVEQKEGNVIGERWEIQQAWDKQANFMSAQSRAMKTLESMIKQYDELLHKNWELATEEQKARINQLKAQTGKITGEGQEIEDMSGIEEEIYGTGQTEEEPGV